MYSDLKRDLVESINILSKLAKNQSPNLVSEISRLVTKELKIKSCKIYKEVSDNKFTSLSEDITSDINSESKQISISDYDNILEQLSFEDEIVKNVISDYGSKFSFIKTFVIIPNKHHKFLFILENNFGIENDSCFQLMLLVKNILSYSSYSQTIDLPNTNIMSVDFLEKINSGLVKEIKTISGLITLINEEQDINSIRKYVGEIKSVSYFLQKTINEFSNIISLEKHNPPLLKDKINIEEHLLRVSEEIKADSDNLKISIDNSVNEIVFDDNILELITKGCLKFISNITKNNSVNITSQFNDGKIRFSFTTDEISIDEAKLSKILEPFENKNLIKNDSGLSLLLLAKYIELADGKLKFINKDNFIINISLPITEQLKFKYIVDKFTQSKDDNILVIESDSAASILMRNYLSKWNYNVNIVDNGEKALNLLKNNKYVAIILNVDQENDNSLELLQKIKNNKSTRNIPVIVFSIEPETEKIYLMGAVDYLVKPINYNNLVEILTSYKLRRNSTVLCVDDDQPTLSLVKQAVQTAGFNVITEYRPELVMDLIDEKDLDLAIIDLDMPKLNGFDLIKLIKSEEKFSKLPIIIYTGKEDYQEDLQKIDGMFVDLLDKKSTSFNELENTISAMIKSYEEPRNMNQEDQQVSGPKILMAEDYKHSQIIVTRLLKKSGFENIIVVENGLEALNICKNEKIDLVLMDMQMPVMNGFEATGKIRDLEGYADTPIISLTAFAMKGDREKCLEAGATDYIPKPIDSKEFIEKVKYYTQVEAKV